MEYFKKELKKYSQTIVDIVNDAGGGSDSELTLTDVATETVFTQNDGLHVISTDNKIVKFRQATEVTSVDLSTTNIKAKVSVYGGSGGLAGLEATAADENMLKLRTSSEESTIFAIAEDGATNTYLMILSQNVEVFKASDAGISTDASTNNWKLGAASAGAPTADSKIRITINGVDYDIAAESV